MTKALLFTLVFSVSLIAHASLWNFHRRGDVCAEGATGKEAAEKVESQIAEQQRTGTGQVKIIPPADSKPIYTSNETYDRQGRPVTHPPDEAPTNVIIPPFEGTPVVVTPSTTQPGAVQGCSTLNTTRRD